MKTKKDFLNVVLKIPIETYQINDVHYALIKRDNGSIFMRVFLGSEKSAKKELKGALKDLIMKSIYKSGVGEWYKYKQKTEEGK